MATEKRERQKAARRDKMERLQREAQRRRTIRRTVIVAVIAAVVITTSALIFSGSTTPTTTTSTTAASATTTTVAGATTTTVAGATTTTVAGSAITQSAANAAAVAAGCPASTTARANTLSWSSAPPMTISTSATYLAHFHTTAGDFVVHLDAKAAPKTVNSFVFLAQHKFYDCVIFHRVIPGFVVQGGDPTGTGTGGPGYQFADELPKTGNPTYPLYSVAMANSGANTNGSQFFIVTGASGESLPNSYSLFGQVISGQSVVMAINNAGTTGGTPTVVHRMLSVTITQQ